MDYYQRNDKKKEQEDQAEEKKATGEIGKGNQMTALRFQTGERHHRPPIEGHAIPRQEQKQKLDVDKSVDKITVHVGPRLGKKQKFCSPFDVFIACVWGHRLKQSVERAFLVYDTQALEFV